MNNERPQRPPAHIKGNYSMREPGFSLSLGEAIDKSKIEQTQEIKQILQQGNTPKKPQTQE